jgi:sugar phosphate permease
MPPDPTPVQPTFAERAMRLIWRRRTTDLPERTRRRVVVYLIPFLFCLYILAYLDRTNIAVASLGMQKLTAEQLSAAVADLLTAGAGHPGTTPWTLLVQAARIGDNRGDGLGFNPKVVGFGAGLFFWGYWILEVPSTLSVLRWGARYVFVRILVLWGLCCTFIGFIGLPWMNRLFGWLPPVDQIPWLGSILPSIPGDVALSQFYFLRFMLGFFEGGFFPVVILYLSLWFRPRDRARAIATFMSAIPVSSMLGSPLSGLMLQLDWLDLPGWRWVFILQGIAPILAGFVTLFFLPDRPEKADWLLPDEKSWLVGELAREQHGHKAHGHFTWLGQAGIVLLLTGYYFCINLTSYGLTMFMPAIIKAQAGLSDQWSAILAGAPYATGLVGMLVNGWWSDRRQSRIMHTAVPLTCLSLGLFLAGWCNSLGWVAVLIMIFGVGSFLYAHLPAFWPIPTIFMGATAAASAIGFINMIGNLGGSVGPTLFGEAADKREYARGLFTLAPFPLVAVAIILLVGYLRRDRLRASRTQHA